MSQHLSRLCSLLLLVTHQLAASLWAQCPITVDAGPDRFVCNPGEQTTLLGSVSGNYIGLLWTPPTGLSDPTSLTPAATVTGPMTYTLTASAFDPTAPNLVSNPAFEQGNTGFTSDYSWANPPITPGTYIITTSPSIVWANFPPCDDHTFGNGTGNMLLVNGAGSPGANVWCQTIAVAPGTWYFMSAWVASTPIDPAQLQFYVNGTPVGNVFHSAGAGCVWEEFTASWYSGTATTANLCIVSQNSGNGLFGDDYALDDIYFGPACTRSDQVSVDVAEVDAVAPPTAFLYCNALPAGIQLDGSASTSGPNISYQWTAAGGNIVSGANTPIATVNAEGTYTLTVTFDDGNVVCQDMATVVVLPDPNIVFANATAPPPAVLDCAQPTLTLSGAGSSTGAGISYSWAPTSGVVSGGNTLNPVVNQGGTYTLTVSHQPSGCTDTASVVVGENFDTPVAVAAVDDTLTCIQTTVTLDGSGSSTGPDISYQWHTDDGHIASGSHTLNNCVVDSAGVYQLTVTNTSSHCTAVAFAQVVANTTTPLADAGPDTSLQCNQNSTVLDGSGSSHGGPFAYLWTTSNGHIVAGADSLTPLVDSAGTYVLAVTDTLNGCTATDTVEVSADLGTLGVQIQAPDNLDCRRDSVVLHALADPIPPGALFLWSTNDGHFSLNDSSEMAVVTSPGTYVLQLLDTLSGCTGWDSASVEIDTLAPLLHLPSSDTLDCLEPVITLTPAFQAASQHTFLWEAIAGGHVVSLDTSSGAATVDAGGQYVFSVEQLGNGCIARDTVQVVNLLGVLEIDFAQAPAITCVRDSTVLAASVSPSGPGLFFEWSTNGGNFLEGSNTLTPVVNQGGIYFLTVFDSLGYCLAMDSVEVMYDTVHPRIGYVLDGQLTCAEPVYFPAFEVDFGEIDSAFQRIGFEVIAGHQWDGSTPETIGFDAGGTYVLEAWSAHSGCTVRDTFLITVDSLLPLITFDPPPTFLCSSDSVQLSVHASPSAEFVWSTSSGQLLSGDSTAMPWVGAPGDYFVTVTLAANGCSSSDTLTVPADVNVPQIELSGASLSCADTVQQIAAVISGVGPFQIVWSTSDGHILGNDDGPQITIDRPGTYTVFVTDLGNGCHVAESHTVGIDTMQPAITILPVQPLNCERDTVLLSVQTLSGGSYDFAWSTPNGQIVDTTTNLARVSAPGSYEVVVTNLQNGCTAQATALVEKDTAAPQVSITWSHSLSCSTPSVQLFGTAQGTGPFSWQWSTTDGLITAGANEPTATIAAGGTYWLVATDLANGCRDSTSLTMSADTMPPQVEIAASGPITCAASTATLSATATGPGPFNWYWTTSDGLILGGAADPTVEVGSAGTYELTVTDLGNGCTTVAARPIAIDTLRPDVDAGPVVFLTCTETITALSGISQTPNVLYQWTTTDGHLVFGANTPMPAVDAPGTYLLTVTSVKNGCTAIDSTRAVSQILEDFSAIVKDASCRTGTGTIEVLSVEGGTPPYLFSVSGGASWQQEPRFADLPPGDYHVVVRDAQGCRLEDTMHVAPPPTLVVSLQDTFQLLLGEELLLQPQLSFDAGAIDHVSWSPAEGLSCPDCLETLVRPLGTASYELSVVDTMGCMASAHTLLIVDPRGGIYAPNAFSPNGDGINDEFLLYARPGLVVRIRQMRIFDRWGGMVFERYDFPIGVAGTGWDGRKNGRLMGPGVYAWLAEIERLDGKVLLLEGEVVLMGN